MSARSRSEFPKPVQRAALARANGHCEGADCGAPLVKHKYQIDHINPDGLAGKPTLDNAQVLCSSCHLEKTRKDVERIARAKRRNDGDQGIKPRQGPQIKSAGFPDPGRRKANPMPSLPPKPMFRERGVR